MKLQRQLQSSKKQKGDPSQREGEIPGISAQRDQLKLVHSEAATPMKQSTCLPKKFRERGVLGTNAGWFIPRIKAGVSFPVFFMQGTPVP